VIKEADTLKLPLPQMRQEQIYKKGRLTIVNDSCATSPDGVIAAVERFRLNGKVVLISGGTDKLLEFSALARVIKKYITQDDLLLLEGSATTKLQKALGEFQSISYSTLSACVVRALERAALSKGRVTVLFSPGAASFEKFLHEFDRGKQFNKQIARLVKK
jgi:UDP-N-acetylmuramoylalanine--D-glutamate ligase